MKKCLLIIGLIAGFTIQSRAQCGSLANTELSSYAFTVQWEIVGNTLYYSMIVNTPTEFIPEYFTENYVGFRVYGGASPKVFEIYYDAESFPYGYAEYCGSFDISGDTPSNLYVDADLNMVVSDGNGGSMYDDHHVDFSLH
jgi:hypothetical protein